MAIELGHIVFTALERNPIFISAALLNRIYPPMFNCRNGGELLIEDTYGTQTVKLSAGDMILYPASGLHRVNPVTRGTRLACFFWVQSMVRDDGQRTMLFDLDNAIQQLTATNADGASRVKLTGVYHNLLRIWAEN